MVTKVSQTACVTLVVTSELGRCKVFCSKLSEKKKKTTKLQKHIKSVYVTANFKVRKSKEDTVMKMKHVVTNFAIVTKANHAIVNFKVGKRQLVKSYCCKS